MHEGMKRRIEALEARRPATQFLSYQEMQECETPRAQAFAAQMQEHMRSWQKERRAYAALSTREKIKHRTRELAQLDQEWQSGEFKKRLVANDERSYQFRRRQAEIHVEILERALADGVEATPDYVQAVCAQADIGNRGGGALSIVEARQQQPTAAAIDRPAADRLSDYREDLDPHYH